MTRRHWLELGPSMIVASGIVLATLVAKLAAESRWLVLGGPLLLALALVGADVLGSRLRGRPPVPSWTSLLLAATFLLAGGISALRDPGLVKTLMPVLGMSGWVPLFLSSEKPRTCRSL